MRQVAFGDEEGVRFGTSLLSSRVLAGASADSLAPLLATTDADGTSLRDALAAFGMDPARVHEAARTRGTLAAYVELHIEQGPVLEAAGASVGVVTAIAGFSRLRVRVTGAAGHAGTVPMGPSRRDALAAAAECVLTVEAAGAAAGDGCVATVGKLDVAPGAANVVPGSVTFTVDVRAPSDGDRGALVSAIERGVADACGRRRVEHAIERLQSQAATPCAGWLQRALACAVAAEGLPARALPSGAGHDGMAMAGITDVGMLFVRCGGGVSHSPDETVAECDVADGLRVLTRFVREFDARVQGESNQITWFLARVWTCVSGTCCAVLASARMYRGTCASGEQRACELRPPDRGVR